MIKDISRRKAPAFTHGVAYNSIAFLLAYATHIDADLTQ
jgi:hypothetical protein